MIIPMQVQGRSDKDGLNPGCLSRVGHKKKRRAAAGHEHRFTGE